ncbi:hypothetical protein CONLIGDRAFT_630243 [Coniochaeta ligniaria NRRL 30616]|uniref:Alpha/beta-hydrolase n=1 Tax=Coniochaeta ligniaria NRRL 30616 TaxID=1408157 RepID=A0A1J7IZH3_9PEZI|nr:hypothetical protein CONLIGDRAFT_630243 [Coniochaeta ligniaria NRRL 30616]
MATSSPPVIDLDDPRFSQVFELPANPAGGRDSAFRIKYVDYGYRNEAHPEQENVLLFFPPLMASRLLHVTKDELGKKHKIRIISLDRPGIGGTDAAAPDKRLGLWREAVPALLAHLGIQHVSMACHSCGTIWALDMVLHHPELLHPQRPYLAIGAPWILPSHTGSTALSVVKLLPAGLIGQADKLARLVNNHIAPVIGTSTALSLSVVAKMSSATLLNESGGRQGDAEDVKLEEGMGPKIMERIYAEGVQGLSSEAVLLMQKVGSEPGWGDWGDYDELVPRLASKLRAAGERVRVDVFYAEKDSLIGNGGSKGPKWMDECWSAPGCDDVIEYRSRVVEGADHDTVWNLRWGAVQEMFTRVGGSVDASPEL